ncbi:MAG: hypothetical protein QOD93_952 [Acetobacteraceae bacterium]|nr:hypothetical protein [Acetobacteraceae bacterium]
MLGGRPPLPALSVVVLSADMAGQPLAGGFANRFRHSWPFARCVFLTEGDDYLALSDQLGVPVRPIDVSDPAPETIASGADVNQKIAVQVQRTWRRCGSTILFENQVEDLVRAGFLTIRLFTDAVWRRGATLRSRLDALVRENSVNAGAHINVVAVPDGPPAKLRVEDADATWKLVLAATASSRIADDAVMQAVGQSECVIANHLECVGPAITFCPQARLLLALHEDRPVSLHHRAMLTTKGEAEAMETVAAAERVQAQILGAADLCTFVSVTDMTRLGPHCRRSVPVLPRVPTPAILPRVHATNAVAPRFDLLLVASEHGLNVFSLYWFLDRVWRPYLEAHSISVAIVGRAGKYADKAAQASPLLHLLGYVEDLDVIRSWCRLTVVPDTGGTGMSIKLLTTLAAGHPLAATRIGYRGLDPSIAEILPSHNNADALAADILALIGSPARLQERQHLVLQVRDAIGAVTDHADLVMTIPRPTAPATRKRLAQWSRLVGPAPAPDAAAYTFTFGSAFAMCGNPEDKQVLLDGWHGPEPWGRWTDGATASLRVALPAPTNEPLTLELDIVPSAIAPNLRVGLDGTMLPLIDPVPGANAWDIPPDLSAGKSSFLVSLHVGETVCPAQIGNSNDDRILGIGVAAVRLLSRQPALCKLNEFMPIRAGAMPSRVLLTGWHRAEEWGCWTSKTNATLRVTMDEPMQVPIRLELNIALPPVDPAVTLSVNGVTLPAITPTEGFNGWDLPPKATNGKTELLVMLAVLETFSAARASLSTDDRELGIGLRGLKVVPFLSTFYRPGIAHGLAAQGLAPQGLAADGMAAIAAHDQVLVSGWHKPEEWGCWTSQRNAVLRLTLRQPLFGPFRLELDMMAMPVFRGLTVSVNGQALPMIVPVRGINRWSLPERLTDEQQTLLIGLEVSDTFRPADVSDSPDDRVMGVGVRTVALHRDAPAACPIGAVVRVSNDQGDRGILSAGWHQPEPWGCWSSGSDAAMLLRFDAPLRGAYVLEFGLTPPLLDPSVTLSVNDTVLGTLSVVDGLNEWPLPQDCTDGKTVLNVHLLVASPTRPTDVKASNDDRVLGIGVRNFRLRAVRGE